MFQICVDLGCVALGAWVQKNEELLYLVQRACPDAGTKPGPGKALGPKQGYRLRRQLKNALNGKTGRQES